MRPIAGLSAAVVPTQTLNGILSGLGLYALDFV